MRSPIRTYILRDPSAPLPPSLPSQAPLRKVKRQEKRESIKDKIKDIQAGQGRYRNVPKWRERKLPCISYRRPRRESVHKTRERKTKQWIALSYIHERFREEKIK
jgi:hypothetical protein